MSLWSREPNVEEMLEKYFSVADACLERMESALRGYLANGHTDEFSSAVRETHRAESAADDLRREIEYTLYGRALLPESRGDLLGLLETYDALPNIAETIVFVLDSQRTMPPDDMITMFEGLLDSNMKAYRLARKCVDVLFNNPKVTMHASKSVDQQESESDQIERRIICEIFNREIPDGRKILLKELTLLIGDISDRAQSVADRISIIAIKRQI